MANTNSNRTLVPEAQDSLEKFKYEVASDIAVKNIFDNSIITSYSLIIYVGANFVRPPSKHGRINSRLQVLCYFFIFFFHII